MRGYDHHHPSPLVIQQREPPGHIYHFTGQTRYSMTHGEMMYCYINQETNYTRQVRMSNFERFFAILISSPQVDDGL